MTKPAKFLDLDAVAPEREIVIKWKGAEHKLVPVSVDDFVKNVQSMENVAKASEQAEGSVAVSSTIGILKDVVARAFPTFPADDLGMLTLPQLNQLADFITANNGTDEVKEEAVADAGANPPTAG